MIRYLFLISKSVNEDLSDIKIKTILRVITSLRLRATDERKGEQTSGKERRSERINRSDNLQFCIRDQNRKHKNTKLTKHSFSQFIAHSASNRSLLDTPLTHTLLGKLSHRSVSVRSAHFYHRTTVLST